MEDLHRATRMYINCDDPTESAARKQRVLDTDTQQLMEETAQGIIEAAIRAQVIQSSPQVDQEVQVPLILPPTNPATISKSSNQQAPAILSGKKRGRPAKPKDLWISPKSFTGSSSRRRIMSNIHASPGTSKGTQQGSKPTHIMNWITGNISVPDFFTLS
ncbi:unnamed protein product [Eruca vesicaria subsp. sativa]|uniref:Uncharacterized protein n=1 Tax=Eruca vesicaria subsp. sativa TaxID=29727 RepID=A0ABC8M6U5_ERUVS|nr:unnamed protein product [Eruca vesicaria subsp. sativa]